jgi:hypothetical protein
MVIRRLLMIAVLGALVVSGCSSSPNGAPSGSTASVAPGPSAGDGGSPGASQPPDLGTAETNLRKDDRARAGLANLGPSAVELAGLMDASGYQALQDEGTRIDPAIAGTAADAPTARLVSQITPGSTIFGPWEFTTTFYERMMTNGLGNTRIVNDRDTLPNCTPGDGTCTGKEPPRLPPGQESGSETYTGEPSTQQVTIGGNAGTITSTATVTAAFDGSKLSMDLEIKIHGEIHDASGATTVRIESVGKGHIDGDACPDASGIARAHIAFSASETYYGSGITGSGYGLRQDFSADVRIHADDQANLAGIEVTAKAHETSQGGVPVAGGASDLGAHDFDAGFTRTLGYDASGGFGTATTTNESASSADATSLYLGMALFTEFPAKLAAKAAETAWRSGMCIRVSPSPNGADVSKDSQTQIKVIVRQRYEDVELDKPVVATLDSGPKAIDPAGQAQPAPATFTYTAGPKDGDLGTVTFKSTSNRGIGQTSASFKVGGGWIADKQQGEQSITGLKCGGLDGDWTIVGKIKSAQIDSTLTLVATINGTTLLGTYTYKSVLNSYPSIVTTGTGQGKASLAVEADGTVLVTLYGTLITNVTKGAGTQVTYSVPIPDAVFTWRTGGTCP